ncbi:hypothetical protein [Desulfoscipio gibsoniae]|uniref:Uncharacterized protein n=1 Tax=Desulfoscipio gibsoniae DSM 7213 TaxID=767817 RepID=R4KAU0_9FIRM|nr:hypothetical protein [Desulfoscipio gibsoniae]AGL00303.1 hypothetical protein Desgi_0748 [Desulfoscipio gibsoniae DSM 7213]
MKKITNKDKGLNNMTVPIHRDNAEPGFIPFYEFAEGLTDMGNKQKADKRDDAHGYGVVYNKR